MTRVWIYNRQRRKRFDPGVVRALVERALPLLEREAPGGATLPGEVEVAVVSDRVIAGVHGRFLGDPTPTDVITFQHGEIVTSADTAAARAQELGEGIERELALYIVHGLLHLLGHDDKEPRGREAMAAAQERVLREATGDAVDRPRRACKRRAAGG